MRNIIPWLQMLSLYINLSPFLSLSLYLSPYLCYPGRSDAHGTMAAVILVDSSAVAVAFAFDVALLLLLPPHL